MSNTLNSMKAQLDESLRLQENGLRIIQAWSEAITSSNTEVRVNLVMSDGSTIEKVIPSNSGLFNRIQSIERSLNNLVQFNGDTILETNGNQRVFLTSIDDKPSRPTVDNSNQIASFENNPLIESLTSPRIGVNWNVRANGNVRDFVITQFKVDSLSTFVAGENYNTVIGKLENIPYTRVDHVVTSESKRSRYYGEFNVLAVDRTEGILLTLDKLTYSDELSNTSDSRELIAGEYILNTEKSAMFQIVSVLNGALKQLKVIHISGTGGLNPGVISFYDNQTTTNHVVKIPLKAREKQVVFISARDVLSGNLSSYSGAILLDSASVKVESNGISYTFDSWFDSNVSSIGSYLESIVNNQSKTREQVLVPEAPELSTESFVVFQINKHLTDTANSERIKKLNIEKNRLTSRKLVVEEEINILRNRLNLGQYESESERTRDSNNLVALGNEKDSLSASLISVVNDISNFGSISSASKNPPRYRVRGFWQINELDGEDGNIQRVVQSRIRYRYLPAGSSAVNTTTVGSGVISSWTEELTNPLKKILNPVTQRYEWELNNITDSDQLNINQADIPISYGESVEFQVQSISEGGWPDNPVTSEWSKLIRIDFPTELAVEEAVAAIVSQNSDNKLTLELEAIFAQSGLTKHLNDQFEDAGKFYAHNAFTIASGYKSADQATISLFDYLTLLTDKITSLETKLARRTALFTIELVSPDGKVFPIYRNSRLDIFAGYYTNSVDLSSPTNYGKVVTQQWSLRISNLSASTAEIQSISWGDLNENTLIYPTGETIPGGKQKNGQILYLRENGVDSSVIWSNDFSLTPTEIPINQQDLSVSPSLRRFVQFDGTAFSRVEPFASAPGNGFVVMSTEHPVYQEYIQNVATEPDLLAAFNRITKMNTSLKSGLQNFAIQSFIENDQFLIGRESQGSRFYMGNVPSVPSASRESVLEIQQGISNSLVIPLTFQTRMTDYLGNPSGDSSLTRFGADFQYANTLAFDILGAPNEIWSFSIRMYSQFRPTTSVIS